MKSKPKFIDRSNTNEHVLELARTKVRKNTQRQQHNGEPKLLRVSEVIINRAIQEMGEVIRAPGGDPRRQVAFSDDGSLTLKLPFNKRVGRPRTNWAISVMEHIWQKLSLNTRIDVAQNQDFDMKNPEHIELVIACAEAKEF